jgi:signal transduction histidine kinase
VGYNHPTRPAQGFVLKYGEGAVGKVAVTGQPLIVDNYWKWEGRSEKFPPDYTTTLIAVPLIWHDQVIGVLNVQAVNVPRYFSPHDLDVLTLFAAQAAIAIQNTRLYEEMRLAHAQLQTLSRQLLEMQETERRNLALELHDHVLSDLAVFTDGLGDHVLSPNSLDSFEKVTTSLRQIVSGLRPHMLDYGLYLALMSLVDALQDRVGDSVKIVLDIPEGESDVRYKEQVELYTYRIVQQACENALRHGQPRALTLRGRLEAQFLQLVIEDDGKGFDWRGKGDLAKLQAEGHFGLAGMLERASIIDADLHIETLVGHGTRVEIEWRFSG